MYSTPASLTRALDGLEVLGVLCVEAVEHRRRALHHLLRPCVVRVEGSQWVRVDSRADVVRQRGLVLPEVRSGARRGTPCRVSNEPRLPSRRLDAGHGELGQEIGQKDDRLGVGQRRVGADHLGVDLVELAIAARLRALVAEERSPAPELHGLRKRVHAVLDVCAADRGCRLRAKRQAAPALVLEREHLLLDDVRGLPDSPCEQLSLLEHRRLDPPVPCALERGRCGDVDARPRRRVGGQDIERPARGFELGGHGEARLSRGQAAPGPALGLVALSLR